MRMTRRNTRHRPFRLRGEAGSTMVGVIGISIVTAVVAVGITGVTMGALATTTSSRSAIQAQAAADSGIAAAVAALNTGVCAPAYTRMSTPAYTVQVAWSTSASSGFANGCPSITSASYLRLTSTGSAENAAAGGLGAHRYVEAVYQYTPKTTTTPPPPSAEIVPSGAALYSYSTSSFGMTGLTLVQKGATRPSVILRSGDFICNSSSVINGDVIAANGKMRIDNCTVNGNAHASKSFELAGSGTINGDVNASGVGADGYSVSMTSPSSSVAGTVRAAGPGQVHVRIGGSFIAAGSSTGKSIFQNSSHVGGSITVAGNLEASGMGACDWTTNRPETNAGAKCIMQKAPKHVDGDIQYQVTGLTAPSVPQAPDWVDYDYRADDFPGFTVVTLTSADCNMSWAEAPGIAKLRAAANSPTPTVLDGRVCSDLSMWYAANPVLNSDLVILAKGFNLGANSFTSYNNQPRKLWIITPDTVDDDQPSCVNGAGNMNINGQFKVVGPLAAMAYTPCMIDQSSTVWRGQMYASYVKMNQNQLIEYDPIGLPGVNLDTLGAASGGGGGSTGPGTTTTDGTGVVSLPALSYRDVSSAG
jgi:hypothetical protein